MYACMTVHEKGAKIITHSLDLEPWRMKVKWYRIFRYNYTTVYIINRHENGYILQNSYEQEWKLLHYLGIVVYKFFKNVWEENHHVMWGIQFNEIRVFNPNLGINNANFISTSKSKNNFQTKFSSDIFFSIALQTFPTVPKPHFIQMKEWIPISTVTRNRFIDYHSTEVFCLSLPLEYCVFEQKHIPQKCKYT